MANELCSPIKKALSQKYGHKNISVKNGKGTAWGWINISIKINRTEACLTPSQKYCNCQVCRLIEREEQPQANLLIKTALEASNLKLYSYHDDMGGNNEKIIVDIITK